MPLFRLEEHQLVGYLHNDSAILRATCCRLLGTGCGVRRFPQASHPENEEAPVELHQTNNNEQSRRLYPTQLW
jgi:hypothetical protein